MAFNQNDAANLLTLKNEVLNNPGVYGDYSVTAPLLEKLNNPALNAGAETGSDSMTAKDLLDIVFVENVSAGNQFRIQLLFESSTGLSGDLSEFKAVVSELDTGLATAIAAITRPLSRAEVLFSVDDANGVKEKVIISRADWFAARDS